MYWLNRLISVCFKSKVQRMAENVCLRQQILVLKRRRPRPQLRDSERRGAGPIRVNVCARTVAKYLRQPCGGTPSPGSRRALEQHARDIWACALFTVRTIWFRPLYVYFVIKHGTREIMQVGVTAHPTAPWLAQQMVETCGTDTQLPRYLIHDRDSCYGAVFNRRVHALGIQQVRTPVTAPKADAIAE